MPGAGSHARDRTKMRGHSKPRNIYIYIQYAVYILYIYGYMPNYSQDACFYRETYPHMFTGLLFMRISAERLARNPYHRKGEAKESRWPVKTVKGSEENGRAHGVFQLRRSGRLSQGRGVDHLCQVLTKSWAHPLV